MKCSCGFEEVPSRQVEVKEYYKSGKRKGELKKTRHEWREGVCMDSYDIRTDTDVKDDYYRQRNVTITLKTCPDCALVYFDSWN